MIYPGERHFLFKKQHKYPTEESFKEYKLFRNIVPSKQRKLNENFTELSLIYIKQISESHGKLLKLSRENHTESQISDEFPINTKIV